MKNSPTWIKRVWKENKGLIILAFIWILVSIVVLVLLCPETSEMIQAEAIATLVFVTIFYAVQTHRLVEKQEKSTTEERKRRDAEFADRKLQEFLSPMIFNLVLLEFTLTDMKSLAELPRFSPGLISIIEEMAKLMKQYMYLLPEETIIDFGGVSEINKKALLLKDDKRLKNWKEDSISAINKFMRGFQKQHSTFVTKLSEVFGVHDKKIIEA